MLGSITSVLNSWLTSGHSKGSPQGNKAAWFLLQLWSGQLALGARSPSYFTLSRSSQHLPGAQVLAITSASSWPLW